MKSRGRDLIGPGCITIHWGLASARIFRRNPKKRRCARRNAGLVLRPVERAHMMTSRPHLYGAWKSCDSVHTVRRYSAKLFRSRNGGGPHNSSRNRTSTAGACFDRATRLWAISPIIATTIPPSVSGGRGSSAHLTNALRGSAMRCHRRHHDRRRQMPFRESWRAGSGLTQSHDGIRPIAPEKKVFSVSPGTALVHPRIVRMQ